jgi:vitellogenic carboxypeptidase-like protein
VFVENGPFKVTINLDLNPNEYAWSIPFNMIYIDQPVGTGFSFTEDDAGYANNQTDVARDLYSCLQQFFTLFDDLRDNEFYVTGESYGGKYVPSIAYKIYQENLAGSEQINLQGIAVGDGLFEVEAFLHYGDFLYQTGLIDEMALEYFHQQEALTAEYIRSSDWQAAFDTFSGFILCGGEGCYYTEQTGLNTYYNYLRTNEPINQDYYMLYLALPRVRRAIHVGNNTYSDGDEEVYDHLEQDIPKSVRDWLSTVMENYRVMVYSGQVDVIVATPLTENFLNTLAWSGAEQYANTPHTIWRVDSSDSDVAGYVRQVGGFYQVTVRDAGHMVPYDQPRAGYSMITNFIFNTPFDD